MKQVSGTFAVQEKQGGFLDAYRQVLPAVFRHPATWLLMLLWLGATIYLFAVGRATFTSTLFVVSPILFVFLTIPLTQGAPPAPWEVPVAYSRIRLWLQCGLSLLCLMLLGLLSLFVHLNIHIPLLISYYAIYRSSTLFRGVLGFIFEIILPLGLVLLLGARWRELGFQKGFHTWRVTILWSILPAPLIVIAVVAGKITLIMLLQRIVLLLFLAGLPEEIGIRGILTTRLMRLMGTGWGIALSAVLFGLLHLGNDIAQGGSTSFLVIVAEAIYAQMSGGLFFAIIFQRTRSLIPGIVSHALSDVLSGLV